MIAEARAAGKIKEGFMPTSSDDDEPPRHRGSWMDRGPFDWYTNICLLSEAAATYIINCAGNAVGAGTTIQIHRKRPDHTMIMYRRSLS
eukprot:SAG31_NODE_18865_length_620_cov_0.735125_1_plen_88_part_10